MDRTAQTFKALSDETRLRILGLLMEGELCVCELMAILDLPQSTVSRHLSYLKNSGLIRGRRQGVWMHYRLAEQEGGAFQRELLALLRHSLGESGEARDDRKKLGKYLSSRGCLSNKRRESANGTISLSCLRLRPGKA